jgi:hypothetical protein
LDQCPGLWVIQPLRLERRDFTSSIHDRDLIGFRLRPVMAVSGWLGVRDEALILSEPSDSPGRWMYWDIVPLQDGSQRP